MQQADASDLLRKTKFYPREINCKMHLKTKTETSIYKLQNKSKQSIIPTKQITSFIFIRIDITEEVPLVFSN
jgi:hypothetical protein